MVYLREHEVGFDLEGIGFPSISGCIAIVYRTSNGLYGLHNAGGSAEDKFQERAKKFSEYVTKHFLYSGKGLCLYGSSFVTGNRRGYGGSSAKKGWKDEMKTFADALGFKGDILGYDLGKTNMADSASAYVEYNAVEGGCAIEVKQWSDAGKETGPNLRRLHHKKILGKQELETVVVAVDDANLTLVTPERLR